MDLGWISDPNLRSPKAFLFWFAQTRLRRQSGRRVQGNW